MFAQLARLKAEQQEHQAKISSKNTHVNRVEKLIKELEVTNSAAHQANLRLEKELDSARTEV